LGIAIKDTESEANSPPLEADPGTRWIPKRRQAALPPAPQPPAPHHISQIISCSWLAWEVGTTPVTGGREAEERGAHHDEVLEVAGLKEVQRVREHGAVGDREQRLGNVLLSEEEEA